MNSEKDKGRLVVDLPYGYINTLDRLLKHYGATRTEYSKMQIENLHCINEELYNGGTLWDRVHEANLRTLEILAKRKRARMEIIDDQFGGDNIPNLADNKE